MKFGSLNKGTRARKRVTLALAGGHVDATTLEVEGAKVELDLRVLTSDEQAIVFERARKFAIDRGVAQPSEDEAIYEMAKIRHTLAIACVDCDSPPNDPQPFFDGGFQQLMTSELLSNDHVAFLYEQYLLWEDEVSPRIKTLSDAQFLAAVIKTAGGDASFFVGSRRGTLWSCFLTLAKLHVSSLAHRSSPGSSSAESGTS